jgi:hypothetical protein
MSGRKPSAYASTTEDNIESSSCSRSSSHLGAFSGCRISPGGVPTLRLRTSWLRLLQLRLRLPSPPLRVPSPPLSLLENFEASPLPAALDCRGIGQRKGEDVLHPRLVRGRWGRPAGARRPNCSPKTRCGGLRPTWRSCRSVKTRLPQMPTIGTAHNVCCPLRPS